MPLPPVMHASLLIFYFQHSNKNCTFKMSQVNFFLSKYYSSSLRTQKRSEIFTVIHKHPHDPSLPLLTFCLTVIHFHHSILLTPGDFMFLEHIKHTPTWESGTAWVVCSFLRGPGLGRAGQMSVGTQWVLCQRFTTEGHSTPTASLFICQNSFLKKVSESFCKTFPMVVTNLNQKHRR